MRKESKEIMEPHSRSMRSGFDSLFDRFRNDFDDMMDFWWPLTPRTGMRPTTIRAALKVGYTMSDIEDKGTHYELKADQPEVSKKDIGISLTENSIEEE